MLPAREFPLDEPGRARFRSRWRELFEGDPSKKRLYRDVSNGVPAAGHRVLPAALLRLGRDALRLPADAAPRSRCTATSARAVQEFWRDAELAPQAWRAAIPTGRCCRRAQLFVPAEEFFVRAQGLRAHRPAAKPDEPGEERARRDRRCRRVAVDRRAQDPLAALKAFLDDGAACACWSPPSRPGRRETMANYFAEYGLKPAPCSQLRGVPSQSQRRSCSCVAPLAARLRRAGREAGRSSPRPSSTPAWCGAAARARGEAQLGRGHAARPVRAQGRRPGGARAARHRPLPGPGRPGPRRGQRRVPAARVRRRRQALRAGRRSSA